MAARSLRWTQVRPWLNSPWLNSPRSPLARVSMSGSDGSLGTSSIRMGSSATEASTGAARASYKIVEKIHNFDETVAGRPDFDHSNAPIEVTKSPDPTWQYGQGVRDDQDRLAKTHKEIDPYAPDRPMVSNYRLLVSGIAPRPIGFISTLSGDGTTKNLAPFSYFQVIDHDPPMFIVGFSSRPGRVKDTFRNLKESGECVINTVSENMIEAVNATSIDAPYGVSEWDVSGLHEAPTTTVKPSRVQESVFSIEGKVIDIKEFSDHQGEGMSIASLVLVKATRFWVREDAADAGLATSTSTSCARSVSSVASRTGASALPLRCPADGGRTSPPRATCWQS